MAISEIALDPGPPAGVGTGSRVGKLVGVAVAVIAAGAALRDVSAGDLIARLQGVGPWALLVLVPFPLSLAVETCGWRRLLRLFGHDVPFASLLRLRLSVEAALLSVPSGSLVAESLKVMLLRDWCGVPMRVGFANAAAHRVLLILSHGLWMGVGAILAFAAMKDGSLRLLGRPGLEWVGIAGSLLLLAGAVALFLTLAHAAPVARIRGWLAVIPVRPVRSWLERRSQDATRTDATLSWLFARPKAWLPSTAGWFVLGWAVETLETFLILSLVGAPIPFVHVVAAETLLSLVRALVVVVPAGLGVQDLGYVAFLTAAGVPEAATVAATFLVLKRGKELFWASAGYALWFTARARRHTTPKPAFAAGG